MFSSPPERRCRCNPTQHDESFSAGTSVRGSGGRAFSLIQWTGPSRRRGDSASSAPSRASRAAPAAASFASEALFETAPPRARACGREAAGAHRRQQHGGDADGRKKRKERCESGRRRPRALSRAAPAASCAPPTARAAVPSTASRAPSAVSSSASCASCVFPTITSFAWPSCRPRGKGRNSAGQ